MGASESKLVFKQGIFRLSEEQNIPADDPYWTGFWELPESTEDVFSLFSPVDIRRTRDTSLANLETLILAVCSRLVVLKNHPSFPDPEIAPDRDALNCIRVLTRVLPFVYESAELEDWEERFFWARRRKKSRSASIRSEVLFDGAEAEEEEEHEKESADGGDEKTFGEDGAPRSTTKSTVPEYEDAKPLGEEIIDTLLDLLFYTGFTIPRLPNSKSKVTFAIWQSGVGCNTSLGSNREMESNRCEVLRLLLTMMSKSMYMPLHILPVQGVKAITYIATRQDKQLVLSVLCSLLNTTIKYNPASWRVPYDHVVWKDPKQVLVAYCLQVLLVILLYPIPEDGRGPPPRNYFRHYFGRLHRPQDFQFLVDGMTRVLSQPMQASSSYLPGSQKVLKWAPEMLMLFWEALQCNKRFRSFIIDTNRAHDFIVLCLFYAIENKTDPSKQGVVKMCIFILQTLSVEPNFGKKLNKRFEAQETLPASVRLANFRGSYADFLIISIHTLMTTSKGKLDAVYPALLAIINNIAAYLENLSATSSSKIMQLFSSMSSPSFLLANESNHTLLASLLEFINAVLEHQFTKNPNLVYAVLKSRTKIETLREFSLENGQQELERQRQLRKTSTSSIDTTVGPDSHDDSRSPAVAHRTPSLSQVPEEDGTFAIGDDSDSENENSHLTDSMTSPKLQQQPSPSLRGSRAPSISSSVDDSVPTQLRGMSEKARGKMPMGQLTFSRQNSTTSLNSYGPSVIAGGGGFAPTSAWIDSWLPELPLHTPLTIISVLTPHLPPPAPAQPVSPNGSPNPQTTHSSDLRTFLSSLPTFATSDPALQTLFSDSSPIRVHLFEWSPLSLGWYESLLWSCIYTSEMHVSTSSAGVTGSISGVVGANAVVGGSASIGTVGVWNGTNVRLFRVEVEGRSAGPTLLAPRGAVDAVGSNLVQRIGNLGFGRRVSGNGAAAAGGNGGNGNGGRTPTTREV